jgi:uroporphyrin-III C-methyltransferase / precorrin-2 dehydrogenase / sirohydrochlorin ferrochelatase
MHSLPLFIRVAGRPVILIGSGPAAEAKARLIERAGGIIIGEDDHQARDARLAFVAIEEPEAAREAADRLRARGLLVNVVDQPGLCDFTTPAVIDRDPVLIAVSSGGASAGLVAALRQRIEALLPDHVGTLARALEKARDALRARWSDAGTRRRALSRALAPGGMLDPLGAPTPVQDWLNVPDKAPKAQIYPLHLRSNDPDDLSLRDARMLSLADRIAHPPDAPVAILARARADAQRVIAEPNAPLPPESGLTVRIITPM